MAGIVITKDEKKLAARILGSLGGHARAKALTPERRREIAAIAGAASKPDIEQKRRAGKLGGAARKAALTPERAREIAIKAVQAREAKRKESAAAYLSIQTDSN